MKNTFQDQTLLVPELKKENLQTKTRIIKVFFNLMTTFLEFLSVFEKNRCVVGGIFKMICSFHNELRLYQANPRIPPLWIRK